MGYEVNRNGNILFTETEEYKLQEKRSFFAVKNNDLIRRQKFRLVDESDRELTLVEQKVLLYIISQIKPDETMFEMKQFSIKEFCAICGIECKGVYYPFIRKTIENIAKRVMWLEYPDKDVLVRWIAEVEIEPKSDIIYIQLHDKLKPYLLLLAENYTKIPIHSIVRMKSRYSIYLYELLRSYAYNKQEIEIAIDYLRKYLNCEDKYSVVTNFISVVIETSIKDINYYTELNVRYECIKKGRKIDKIKFFIKDLDKGITPLEQMELIQRISNVDKEINPNQMTLFERMYSND